MKTKKIKFTILTLLFAAPILGYSQESATDTRDVLHFGIKAGFNISNVYDEKSDDFGSDPKFGFAGGAFMNIPISRFIGVQPEILFSQKGFNGKSSSVAGKYEFTRTTNFIDIPLQLAIKPSEYLTIVGGVQYSYLLSQKDTYSSDNVSTSEIDEFENDDIRKNILGLIGGVDVHIKPITISGRVGRDIQNNNGNGNSTTPRYKNTWIQGTIGYRI